MMDYHKKGMRYASTMTPLVFRRELKDSFTQKSFNNRDSETELLRKIYKNDLLRADRKLSWI